LVPSGEMNSSDHSLWSASRNGITRRLSSCRMPYGLIFFLTRCGCAGSGWAASRHSCAARAAACSAARARSTSLVHGLGRRLAQARARPW
jgi:hypothetical protein